MSRNCCTHSERWTTGCSPPLSGDTKTVLHSEGFSAGSQRSLATVFPKYNHPKPQPSVLSYISKNCCSCSFLSLSHSLLKITSAFQLCLQLCTGLKRTSCRTLRLLCSGPQQHSPGLVPCEACLGFPDATAEKIVQLRGQHLQQHDGIYSSKDATQRLLQEWQLDLQRTEVRQCNKLKVKISVPAFALTSSITQSRQADRRHESCCHPFAHRRIV